MAVSKIIQLLFKVKGAGETKSKTGEVDGALAKLAKTALKVAVALKAVQETFQFVVGQAERAGKFEGLNTGFHNLTMNAGLSSDTLEQLQTATDGTVDSMELMKFANNAMLLGIADSSEGMAEMFDIAQRLGKAMGEETSSGINSMITGMGRQSKLMLDNLGIMVDLRTANSRYAEELEKTVKQLTESEKKTAFNNETLRQGRILVGQLGEETFTSADKMDQMRTALSEAGIELGTFFTPLVNAGSFVAKGLAGATANLVGALNDFLGLSPELTGTKGGMTEFEKATQHIAEKMENLNIATTIASERSLPALRDTFGLLQQEMIVGRPLYTEYELHIDKLTKTFGMFDEVAKKTVPQIREVNASWLSEDQMLAVDMTRDLANNLASAVIHGQDMGEAVVSSLKAIVIEMTANLAILTLLNTFTGGQFGATSAFKEGGGIAGFLLKGFSGQTPTVNNNINISGGLVSDSYVRNTLSPALNRVRAFA